MLQDKFARRITYLRVSVTDRCNFRCVYCMPEQGISLAPKSELLTFEEIARVARVGAELGVTKIRLTGGEPTVRRELPSLVALLSAIPGIEEIAMTTNASRLAELAVPLKQAGLTRINISLDTLLPGKAFEISRRDSFEAVSAGIEAAYNAGLTPLKFNAVIMRGTNDGELAELIRFAHGYGAQMRFIEYMPMGEARFDSHNRHISAAEMRELLRPDFDLVPETISQPAEAADTDPARGWVCRRSGARVGFISSISEQFCATCNRMRLTAEGGLRPCLHQNAEVNIRALLRSGGSDEEIATAYHQAAGLKWAGHHMTDFIPLYSAKDMVSIGG